MVNNYEAVYIFDTQVPEDRINEKLDRFHALITGAGTGEVTATDHWGRRQLAYPIRKSSAGRGPPRRTSRAARGGSALR